MYCTFFLKRFRISCSLISTVFILCALWVCGDMVFHHPMGLAEDSVANLNIITDSISSFKIPQVQLILSYQIFAY